MQKYTISFINKNLKVNAQVPDWLPDQYARYIINLDIPKNTKVYCSWASSTVHNESNMLTFINDFNWDCMSETNTITIVNKNGIDITSEFLDAFTGKTPNSHYPFADVPNQRFNPNGATLDAIKSYTADGENPYETLPVTMRLGIINFQTTKGINTEIGSLTIESDNNYLYVDSEISLYSNYALNSFNVASIFPNLTNDNKNGNVIRTNADNSLTILRLPFMAMIAKGTPTIKQIIDDNVTPIESLDVNIELYNYNALGQTVPINKSAGIFADDILFDIYTAWNNNAAITEETMDTLASVIFIGKSFPDMREWAINYGQLKENLTPTLIPLVKPRCYIRCRKKGTENSSNYVYFDIAKNGDIETTGSLETSKKGILTINLSYDEPPNNNQNYDDTPSDSDVTEPTEPSDTGLGVFNTLYIMSKSALTSLGAELWSGSIFDNFDLLNNSPLENIISCKLYPFTISGGTQSTVKIGNVQFKAIGNKYTSAIASISCGSVFIAPYFNNFLDRNGYTKLAIYLPFIGYKELNIEEFINNTLSVKYNVDLITGTCEAIISSNSIVKNIFNGSIGIDIPISASNRAQIENGFITGLLKSGMSLNPINAIGSIVDLALASNHYSTEGNPTPCASLYNPLYCYVIIDRPTAIGSKPSESAPFIPSQSFRHTYGLKCNLQLKLSSVSGYTQIKNIDLSGLTCSDEEKNELKQILSEGVYF